MNFSYIYSADDKRYQNNWQKTQNYEVEKYSFYDTFSLRFYNENVLLVFFFAVKISHSLLPEHYITALQDGKQKKQ